MDHQNIFPALRDELALLRQRVVELEAVEAELTAAIQEKP